MVTVVGMLQLLESLPDGNATIFVLFLLYKTPSTEEKFGLAESTFIATKESPPENDVEYKVVTFLGIVTLVTF